MTLSRALSKIKTKSFSEMYLLNAICYMRVRKGNQPSIAHYEPVRGSSETIICEVRMRNQKELSQRDQ